MREQLLTNEKDLLPDFFIIGAMKCATTSLHDQLSLHDSFFMTDPKEPNFFSDDDKYGLGMSWYSQLFGGAKAGELKGESSTHYTKLPDYPKTVDRIKSHCPNAKFVYVMRHPIDRLVSHYIHQWTQAVISCDIDQAVEQFPELVNYSCYSKQILPYTNAFGTDAVLPVFMERLNKDPIGQLARIFAFLGVQESPSWHSDLVSNVSSERMRKSELRDRIVDYPAVKKLRRALVPKSARTWVRDLWTMKSRPELEPATYAHLVEVFDEDLAKLGASLGISLSCNNFRDAVLSAPQIQWAGSDAVGV